MIQGTMFHHPGNPFDGVENERRVLFVTGSGLQYGKSRFADTMKTLLLEHGYKPFVMNMANGSSITSMIMDEDLVDVINNEPEVKIKPSNLILKLMKRV